DEDKDDEDKPNGGMDTGGGHLALVNYGDEDSYKDEDKDDKESWKKDDHDKDWKKDDYGKDDYDKDDKDDEDKDDEDKDDEDKDDEDKDSYGGHDKPSGGMHTGGGALAAPDVTAGGLAALALAGTGLYAVRRKKSANGLA
ncbi:hypothetical protein ACFW2D_39630, partial [Streptomyces sp. NPDC058914]